MLVGAKQGIKFQPGAEDAHSDARYSFAEPTYTQESVKTAAFLFLIDHRNCDRKFERFSQSPVLAVTYKQDILFKRQESRGRG